MSTLPTTTVVDGMEIFSAGKWNGDEYSVNDLDSMVTAFGKVGFQPPVKAGHQDGQENAKASEKVFGEPALGYASRIYRSGQKLFADFTSIPKRFADLIKASAYKRVSSEIYWNYKDEFTGQVFPRVLKAVAFLGADIPALTNLKAIESLYSKHAAGAEVRIYCFQTSTSEQKEIHMDNEQLLRDFAADRTGNPVATSNAVKQYPKSHGLDPVTDFKLAAQKIRKEYGGAQPTKSYQRQEVFSAQNIKAASRVIESYQQDLVKKLGISQSEALRRAIRIEPEWGEIYCDGQKVEKMSLNEAYGVTKKYGADPLSVITNIAAAHRTSSGALDWSAGLSAVRGKKEEIMQAATNEIDRRAKIKMSSDGVPGLQSDFLPGAVASIKASYPGLAKAAQTGPLDIPTLQLLLWSKTN